MTFTQWLDHRVERFAQLAQTALEPFWYILLDSVTLLWY